MAEAETKIETKSKTADLAARWASITPRTRTSIAVGILLFGFAITLRGLLRYQGPPMEEGFMLVFPERILKGDIPNKDFLHLYGTGSLWVLAGVFKVFGTSLTSERLVALAQQMGVVFGIFLGVAMGPHGRHLVRRRRAAADRPADRAHGALVGWRGGARTPRPGRRVGGSSASRNAERDALGARRRSAVRILPAVPTRPGARVRSGRRGRDVGTHAS